MPLERCRVVEGAALEMLYRGNSIEGSNPSSPFHTGLQAGFYCPIAVVFWLIPKEQHNYRSGLKRNPVWSVVLAR